MGHAVRELEEQKRLSIAKITKCQLQAAQELALQPELKIVLTMQMWKMVQAVFVALVVMVAPKL